MIRRERPGRLLLITQHDHALLAGRLARHVGNADFHPPARRRGFVRGVALHDAGWIEQDACPLVVDGRPATFFDVPRPIAYDVWTESARLAAARDPYGGLLAALHVMHLAARSLDDKASKSADTAERRRQFALVQFEHRMAEMLHALRKTNGLRTDRPTMRGLAHQWQSPAEDRLRRDFRLLQLLDWVSLAACCMTPPTDVVPNVPRRPGGAFSDVRIGRIEDDPLNEAIVTIAPWPFGAKRINLSVAHHEIPDRTYAATADLLDEIERGTRGRLPVTFRPG